jgi:hypothetical protein
MSAKDCPGGVFPGSGDAEDPFSFCRNSASSSSIEINHELKKQHVDREDELILFSNLSYLFFGPSVAGAVVSTTIAGVSE